MLFKIAVNQGLCLSLELPRLESNTISTPRFDLRSPMNTALFICCLKNLINCLLHRELEWADHWSLDSSSFGPSPFSLFVFGGLRRGRSLWRGLTFLSLQVAAMVVGMNRRHYRRHPRIDLAFATALGNKKVSCNPSLVWDIINLSYVLNFSCTIF